MEEKEDYLQRDKSKAFFKVVCLFINIKTNLLISRVIISHIFLNYNLRQKELKKQAK